MIAADTAAVRVLRVASTTAAAWLLLGAPAAHATHFRYGTISWAPAASPARTIIFQVQDAFRRASTVNETTTDPCINTATLATKPCTGAGGFPGVGDVVREDIGGTQFFFGDGTQIPSGSTPMYYVVTSVDTVNNWFFASGLDPASFPSIDTTITHTYGGSTTSFTAGLNDCCRILANDPPNGHINNPNGTYRVQTIVNVGGTFSGNSSPVSTQVPIVTCPYPAVCTFTVPGVDSNGDTLFFRMATAAEAEDPSGANPQAWTQPGPPTATNAATINSSTGLYTWNTTGATLAGGSLSSGLTTLYSTQVIIEDRTSGGTVKSHVPVDFLIQLVPIANNPPACSAPSPQTVTAGQNLSFTASGNDPDSGDTVTLNVAGLPSGATQTPALPTTGPNTGVSSVFNWTPALNQVGTYVVQYSVTDSHNQQALCPVTITVQCTAALCNDNNPCTDDTCTPSGCGHTNNTAVCRPAAGDCDNAESCDGAGNCPADGFKSSATVCRSAANECDLQEVCSGSSAACPADTVKASGTACTDDGNVCTTDLCNGTAGSPACVHNPGNAGTTCRAAADECDLAETCTGSSATCPADAKKASGTACTADSNPCTLDRCDGTNVTCQHPAGNAGAACRAALNECDLQETCTGSSTTCPTDGVKAGGTACTDDGNVCTTDLCNGTVGSPACVHAAGNAGTVCRAAANECDLAETCTGSSTTCPTDGVKASGTACTDDGNACTTDVCNGTVGSPACIHAAGNAGTLCYAGSGDVCDPAKTCTGTSSTCPAATMQPSSFTCRAAGGECDLAENCTGTAGQACPGDAKKANGTACTDDGNVCTTDTCNGSSNLCQHPAGNGGTLCYAGSGDVCDPAKTCTGTSSTCPAATTQPSSFTCRAAGGECDLAENCTGTAGQACPGDTKKANATACTDDGNVCTTDTCNGSSNLCQHPAGNGGTLCYAGSGDVCDPAKTCTGTSSTCPAATTQPSSFTCRAAGGECDLAEHCTGVAGQACPADAKKVNGTACTDDGNVCTTDTCDGSSTLCQHPAGNAGTVCYAGSGDVCDPAKTCTGTGSTCPAATTQSSSFTCRAAAGECDLAENCSGVAGQACPADAKKTNGTACTDDGNPCTTDTCNGSSTLCQHPAGNAGTVCYAGSGDVCDPAKTCTGTSSTCPAATTQSSSFTCRAAAGECDLAENCSGVAGQACPADAKKTNGTGCTDDGNVCTADTCNGSSNLCQHPPGNAGTVCRPPAGVCDVAETCTGSSATCPADGFEPGSTVCRASAGECDLNENCTGSSANCPADAKKSAGTACTDDGNPCSTDVCDGSGNACTHPAGNAGAVCRPGSGDLCDPHETCTGTSTTCPTDVVQGTGFTCRAAAGECDLAEQCTGVAGATCPADAKKASGTACTDDGNVCTTDTCDGSSDLCQHPPGNAGTTCRPSAGACDIPETCTGSSAACPADAKSTAVCRPSAGVCDIAESCDGVNDNCPANAFESSFTMCRASAGPCDPAENCTGSSAACPADGKSTAVCRPSAGACDVAESCNGTNNNCPADGFQPASTVCRPSAGVCDPAENCTGSSAACPADAKSTSVCRPSVGVCDAAESCDGTNDGCPVDGFQSSSTVCRPSAGACDPAENCSGSGASCPADAKSASVCRAATGPCDVAESCDGVGNACPPDAHAPDATPCTDGDACTLNDACSGGTCTGTPKDCSDADQCTTDTCNPSDGTCQHSTPPLNCCQTDAQCSDGNFCTTDACVSHSCTHTPVTGLPPEADPQCGDMIDNDCNGLIDCDDPGCQASKCIGGTHDGESCASDQGQELCFVGHGMCHCPSIRKDPTKIKFGKPGQLDAFTSHGRVVIEGDVDVAGSILGWLLTNSQGAIFNASLPPGVMTADFSKTDFKYFNKAAKTTGGIRKAQNRISRGRTSYGYRVEAYGDISKATDANMSLMFYVGAQQTPALHRETWTRMKWGWKTHLFD